MVEPVISTAEKGKVSVQLDQVHAFFNVYRIEHRELVLGVQSVNTKYYF